MKLDHIGLATKDFEKTSQAFLNLGFSLLHREPSIHAPKNMRINQVFLNDFVIEIMGVADPHKPSFIDEALESTTQTVTLHHFCWLVDDISATFDRLLKTGHYTVHEDITGTVLTPGNKIGFLKHENLRWIEFIERVTPRTLPAVNPKPEIWMGHIGYVTKDLDAASEAFLELGLEPMYESYKHHIPRNMLINREKVSNLELEIMTVADSSKPSFLDETLQTMAAAPSGLEHINYRTDDIYQTVYNLITFHGFRTRNPIQTSYLYPPNKGTVLSNDYTGLVEISYLATEISR